MRLTLCSTCDINQRHVQKSCRNLISPTIFSLYKWDLMWESEIFAVFNALERILISVFTHSKTLYAFPLGETKLFVHFSVKSDSTVISLFVKMYFCQALYCTITFVNCIFGWASTSAKISVAWNVEIWWKIFMIRFAIFDIWNLCGSKKIKNKTFQHRNHWLQRKTLKKL